jgi:hypothetical protein
MQQERAEAARKAREEAETAARLAVERAEKLAALADAGKLAGTGIDPVTAAQEAAQSIEAAKAAEKAARAIETAKVGAGAQYTGPSGAARALHQRTRWFAKINEPEKALMHFKTHSKLLEALQRCCDAAVKDDHNNPPPGCEAAWETSIA